MIGEENDPAALELLDSVLSRKTAKTETAEDASTDEDRVALEEGLAEIRAVRITTWEDVKQILEEQKSRKELTKLNA